MQKILFVCHGNICRSVMAQWIFQNLCRQNGAEAEFLTDSAAVSGEETGNSIYPPARAELQAHHVPVGSHRARRITKKDYEEYDHIYLMDDSNFSFLRWIIPDDPDHKIEALDPDHAIADPWYTDDFETAYQDILKACQKRFEELRS